MKVLVWDRKNLSLLYDPLTGHKKHIHSLALSSDGSIAVTGGD